jgi:hypothetical protein
MDFSGKILNAENLFRGYDGTFERNVMKYSLSDAFRESVSPPAEDEIADNRGQSIFGLLLKIESQLRTEARKEALLKGRKTAPRKGDPLADETTPDLH